MRSVATVYFARGTLLVSLCALLSCSVLLSLFPGHGRFSMANVHASIGNKTLINNFSINAKSSIDTIAATGLPHDVSTVDDLACRVRHTSSDKVARASTMLVLRQSNNAGLQTTGYGPQGRAAASHKTSGP